MSTRTTAVRQPIWAQFRRRVPGAPTDLTLHVLPLAEVLPWAQSATGCLAQDELARAGRIEEDSARELFVVSRVALRHVLAHRLGCTPAEVPVTHDPRSGAPHEVHGRARTVAGARPDAGTRSEAAARPDGEARMDVEPLSDIEARSDIEGLSDAGPELGVSPALGAVRPVHFSVSRTAGVVALLTAQREVGVDVERLQNPVEADVLLEVLHPADRTRIAGLRGRRRAAEVTRTWTRVEALVKAWRTGLARDPASIGVGAAARARYGADWAVSDVRTSIRENARLAVAWRTDPAPQG